MEYLQIGMENIYLLIENKWKSYIGIMETQMELKHSTNHIHISRTVCNQTLYFYDSFQNRGLDITYLQY